MLIRLECREVNKWPVIFVSPPVPQSGDGIRLQNYGQDRYRELKFFCDRQRELTKLAREGKKVKSPTTFASIILEAIIGKPLDQLIDDEVNKRLKAMGVENDDKS